MPLSGSYFYPTVNAPNSSYPSVDLRPSPSPGADSGLGKIYVNNSEELIYLDPSGGSTNLSSGGGGGSGSSNVFDDIYVSGSIIGPGHLVLSSSVGSVVYVSGSIQLGGSEEIILDEDGDTTISSRGNDDRIFFGLAGGTNQYEFQTNNTIFRRELWLSTSTSRSDAVIAKDTDLVLSSSATSIVHASSSLQTEGQIGSLLSTTLSPSGSNQTQIIDLNQGNSQVLLLNSGSDALTASFNNPVAGNSYIIKTVQHNSSPIGVFFSGSEAGLVNVLWEDGNQGQATQTTDAEDLFSFWFDGSNFYATHGSNFS